MLQIIRAAETTRSWSPERLVVKDNLASWLRNAVKKKFQTWYKTPFAKDRYRTVLDVDIHSDNDIAATAAGGKVVPEYAEDPAEVVTDSLALVLISPNRRAWAEGLLKTLRQHLDELSRTGEKQVEFFAGWMRYQAGGVGAGTLTDYSERRGVSKATGSRYVTAVKNQLAKLIAEDPGHDGKTRELTLEFLHFVSGPVAPMLADALPHEEAQR